MELLRKIEQATAKKLMRLFMDAQKYADHAIEDIEKAEKALEDARNRAADATQRQHAAALEAAQKARDVADQLALEAIAAEQRAKEYSRR